MFSRVNNYSNGKIHLILVTKSMIYDDGLKNKEIRNKNLFMYEYEGR